MKIFVVNKFFIQEQPLDFFQNINLINIRNSDDVSYVPKLSNILELIFDDIENKHEQKLCHGILYSVKDSDKIIKFIDSDTFNKFEKLYINCAAGICRSGAIGYVLNEYFNKYLHNNKIDYDEFVINHKHIIPNTLVKTMLYNALFGRPDYSKFFKKTISI